MGLSSHPNFTVTAEKVPRNQQGFSNVLKFEAEGTQVSIEMEINGKVQVNDRNTIESHCRLMCHNERHKKKLTQADKLLIIGNH